MRFYGREGILARIEGLVQVPRDTERRPLLLVEGNGGSGRSELAAEALRRWSPRAPAALVDGLRFDLGTGEHSAATPVRLVLGEMMRQFQRAPHGYSVRWGRMSLLLVAMQKEVDTTDASGGEKEMLDRLAKHGRSALLADLLDWFMSLPISVQAGPASVRVDIGPAARAIARSILGGLSVAWRGSAKGWSAELAWIAPPGMERDPRNAIGELIRISRIAGQRDEQHRREVDSLLMRAFLADITESASRLRGRPYNFLLVLDNSDSLVGQDFLQMLCETRRELFHGDYRHDPLTVVAVGGLVVLPDLAAGAPGGGPADAAWAAAVTRVRLDDLPEECMGSLRREYPCGADHVYPTGPSRDHLVHRLTGGHCQAAKAIFERLPLLDPKLPLNLDELLGAPWTEDFLGIAATGQTLSSRGGRRNPDSEVAGRILTTIIKGLTPDRVLKPLLVRDLVTLAAGRTIDEARTLRGRLLMSPPADQDTLFSGPLWSHLTPDGCLAMIPVTRHLLLRELQARDQNSIIGWEKVFGTLQERAEERERERAKDGSLPSPAARADRMHRRLALGEITSVVEELASLVRQVDEATWLSHLDAATATPAPIRLAPSHEPPAAMRDLRRNIYQLAYAHQQESDTWHNNSQQLHNWYSELGAAYIRITDHVPADWTIIHQRAQYYLALAARIA